MKINIEGEYPILSRKDFGSSVYYFVKRTLACIRVVRGYSPNKNGTKPTNTNNKRNGNGHLGATRKPKREQSEGH